MSICINPIRNIFPFLLTVVLLGFSVPAFSQEGAAKLTPDQFELQAKKSKKAVILDIRTPEETVGGYIEGATFANWLGEDFESEISKLDKKKTYYVYCRSAKRTIPATEKMKELGFKKVYVLDGGLNNWVEKGKPLAHPQE